MEGCFFINEYTSDVLETTSLTRIKPEKVEKHNRRKMLRKIWGKINVSPNSYVDGHLGDTESSGFFAAGVVPFLRVWNTETKKEEISVLLLKEQRGKSKSAQLNFLGGKREMKETPNHTVYREFLEETDRILSDKQKNNLQKKLKAHHCVMWVASGRYVLKGISCPKSFAKLPVTFVYNRKRARAEDNPKFRRKTYGLVWVPLVKLDKVWSNLSLFCKNVCSTQLFKDFVGFYCWNTKQLKFFKQLKWNIKDSSDRKKSKIEPRNDPEIN